MGYFVCPEHWEPRHPQDFVRPVPDNMSVPWAQDMSDTFTGPNCTLMGISAVPNWAIPDCMIPGKLFISLLPGPETPFGISCIAAIAIAGVSVSGEVF